VGGSPVISYEFTGAPAGAGWSVVVTTELPVIVERPTVTVAVPPLLEMLAMPPPSLPPALVEIVDPVIVSEAAPAAVIAVLQIPPPATLAELELIEELLMTTVPPSWL